MNTPEFSQDARKIVNTARANHGNSRICGPKSGKTVELNRLPVILIGRKEH